MDYTAETVARQREAQLRRTVAHATPKPSDPHPVRRRAARSLRRIANALDLND